jgi:hypothetical protein
VTPFDRIFDSSYVNAIIEMAEQFLHLIQEALSTTYFPKSNSFTILIGAFLSGAIAWHACQLLLAWYRNHALDWTHVHKLAVGFIIMGLMAMAPAPGGQGSIFGYSYKNSVGGLGDKGLRQMANAIKTVNIVTSWDAALVEAKKAKQKRTLEWMTKHEPAMRAAFDRTVKASNAEPVPPGSDPPSGEPAGEGELGKSNADGKGWQAIQAASSRLINFGKDVMAVFDLAMDIQNEGRGKLLAELGGTIFRATLMKAIHTAASYAFSLAYIALAIYSLRLLLIFAVTLKIGLWLGFYFLPPMLGLMFWEKTRHFAIQAIKNIVIMTIIAGSLTTITGAIFSPQQIKSYAATSLKETPTGSRATSITKSDVLLLYGEALIYGKDADNPNKLQPSDDVFYLTMDMTTFFSSMLAPVKIMVIIWLMMSVIAKIYEAIQGTLDGRWDANSEFR